MICIFFLNPYYGLYLFGFILMDKVDLHQDIILSFKDPFLDFWDEAKVIDEHGTYAWNYDAYLSTDLKIVVAANRPYMLEWDFADVHWRKITYNKELFEVQQSAMEKMIELYNLGKILSVKDLHKNTWLSVLLHIEWIDHTVSVQDIHEYFKRWIRSVWFVWNFDNYLAHSNSTVSTSENWLTARGREIVAEMNMLWMIIDTAHMNHTSMMDVIRYSSKPIMNSHSNLKHFCAHPRNVEDAFLVALKNNWGVLWLSVYELFVWSQHMDDYIEQIAYVIDYIWDEYVALGTDFHWLPTKKCVRWLAHIFWLRALEEKIIKRFWQEVASKFFRGNAMRVFQKNLPSG